jgi:hypothetical protein
MQPPGLEIPGAPALPVEKEKSKAHSKAYERLGRALVNGLPVVLARPNKKDHPFLQNIRKNYRGQVWMFREGFTENPRDVDQKVIKKLIEDIKLVHRGELPKNGTILPVDFKLEEYRELYRRLKPGD